MPIRRDVLSVGEVYHVFSRSIAGYRIFTGERDCKRMLLTLKYYRQTESGIKFSRFLNYQDQYKHRSDERLVDVIAYCLMPTHIHLILKQLKDEGISTYMRKVLNSYARYFNTKYIRKGPLYEGRFRHVIVESNEQLYHLTRYIHLNPVTAQLAEMPEQWEASSYNEFILNCDSDQKLCTHGDLLDIDKEAYREFVMSRREYQRELAEIKHLLIE
jgi:putative transposase